MPRTIQMTGHYVGCELDVKFSQTFTETDYGVEGSPVILEGRGDFEIVELAIMGEDVQPEALPIKVHSAIMDLADELEDWEIE